MLLAAALLIQALVVGLAGCTGAGPTPAPLPEGQRLRLFDIGPLTLDPAVAISGRSISYIVEIFSGLVSYNPDLELEGEIAATWDVSDDGLTYTFHLRDDARFHDGKPVTAADFKYSLERACDPATGSQTAATYLGDIVGATDKLEGNAEVVSGIRVVDDLTLEITIDARKQYFLAKLAHPAAYVVDREDVETGADWWLSPNATGAFCLEEWRPDELVLLKRNDGYYGGAPMLEEVEFNLWSGIPMRLYESGEIDITSVSLGDIERVLDPDNLLNQELHVTPSLGFYMIGFNCAEPPFDDAQVRRAFTHAVDRDKIVDLTLKGLVSVANGILPPAMPGYNEDLDGLAYDPDLARTLLAESRYGGPEGLPPITMTSSGQGYPTQVEEAVADMWRRNLGVEVEIRQLEPEKYPYLVGEEKDQLFTLGWGADYPDPQNFLDVLFHTGTEENIGEYSNAEVDRVLEQARVEGDESARMALYQEAEQAIVDDAACLPLYFDVSYTLVKPYVEGFPLTTIWIPRLKYVSIDVEE
jgi:oligopeptide transport system substrate-binding protein